MSEKAIDRGAGAADSEVDRHARAAIARGDRKGALLLLMRAYGERLHRYCTWLVSDRALAEDFVQTAFCELYEDFDKDQGGPFYGWLHRVARNDCLDHLKSPKRKIASNDETKEEADESGTPLDLLLGHESDVRTRATLHALSQCIESLPSGLRPIVVMRFFEKLTYPEIGTFFKEHPATLQARATAALRALRGCIESKGHAL